jgi:hypothetical protein
LFYKICLGITQLIFTEILISDRNSSCQDKADSSMVEKFAFPVTWKSEISYSFDACREGPSKNRGDEQKILVTIVISFFPITVSLKMGTGLPDGLFSNQKSKFG